MVADPREFAGVRQTVRAQLNDWGQEGFVDAAVMCVTEILANVHRHVESPECELWLETLPEGGLRLAVSDGSAQPPVVVNRELYAEGGRGMALVTGVADRWWTEPVGVGGKRVWVVLCERG